MENLELNGPWKLRYSLIFTGQALSLIGSALTQFVLLWWIADTQNSVAALANAALFALLPQALFSPIGGLLADRFSRRFIMIVSDAISALCMLFLIWMFQKGGVELWQVYAMMFIRSTMQAFQQPAANASTSMLVPEHFLGRAAGLSQIMNGIMSVAAAPLGALAMSLVPIGQALFIDVITAVLGIVPLLFYSIPQNIKEARGGFRNLWTEFKEGFDIVWSNKELRVLFLLLALVTAAIMPALNLVPLLVKEYFKGRAGEVAIIEGFAGAGMILGGIAITALNPQKRALWIIWGFGLSCLAIAGTAMVPNTQFYLAVAIYCLSSFLFIVGNGPLTALIQSKIPNELQGRALSLIITVTAFAAPFGLFLLTPIGEKFGIQVLFIISGLGAGIITLFGLILKSVRKL